MHVLSSLNRLFRHVLVAVAVAVAVAVLVCLRLSIIMLCKGVSKLLALGGSSFTVFYSWNYINFL